MWCRVTGVEACAHRSVTRGGTETPASTDELLALQLRARNVTLEKVDDLAALRALADAEINGEKRTNVLNVIQKHLGRVAMEMPEAPTEVPFDPAALFDASIEAGMDTDIEDLLKAGANAEVTDSPISSGTVQHSRPAKVRMYAPARDGERPRGVAGGNAKGKEQNQGYRRACPGGGRGQGGDGQGGRGKPAGRAGAPFQEWRRTVGWSSPSTMRRSNRPSESQVRSATIPRRVGSSSRR